MPSSSADIDLFPLSWLSQYGYCPRRCGLLALEQLWSENAETASGRAEHARVHTARQEHRGDKILLYETGVFSRSLGVSGKCDCVEAWADPDGAPIPYGEGRFRLYPIEYKHGLVREEEEYLIQLCAQAICLEEQFSCTICEGAIFYIDAHRRFPVTLSRELREKTMETARNVRELLTSQELPPAKCSAKCQKCSMAELCQPKLKKNAAAYCGRMWQFLEEASPE